MEKNVLVNKNENFVYSPLDLESQGECHIQKAVTDFILKCLNRGIWIQNKYDYTTYIICNTLVTEEVKV